MKVALIKILAGLFLLMFVGIKYEPEFGEAAFFIKHKPNFKFEYFSPIGESDLAINDFDQKNQYEELKYQEFVVNYYNKDFLSYLTYFIVPLIGLLFVSVLLDFVKNKIKPYPFQFIFIEYAVHFFVFMVMCILCWNIGNYGEIFILLYFSLVILSGILLRNFAVKRQIAAKNKNRETLNHCLHYFL
jgi:hypothetical protein